MEPRKVKILTPAKVNLFLRVLGRRTDGFHEIFSLMDPVSVYDELTVGVGDGEGIVVRTTEPDIPEGPENIAFRAAELFLSETGLKRRVTVDIKKTIPHGAGLGGGSSDCAAVLKALNLLLDTGLDTVRLMDLSARLGSDVPFFIPARPALARGRGEKIEAVEVPLYHYVILKPPYSVSTARIYGNLHLTKGGEDNILSFSKKPLDDPSGIRDLLQNDLEAVTETLYPETGMLKAALMDAGASGALTSGSGSAVFGVFLQRDKALEAAAKLKEGLKKRCTIFTADGRAGFKVVALNG